MEKGKAAVLRDYTKAMDLCAQAGQWTQAISLMREMRVQGVDPDVICYCAAVKACAKARQVKEAM